MNSWSIVMALLGLFAYAVAEESVTQCYDANGEIEHCPPGSNVCATIVVNYTNIVFATCETTPEDAQCGFPLDGKAVCICKTDLCNDPESVYAMMRKFEPTTTTTTTTAWPDDDEEEKTTTDVFGPHFPSEEVTTIGPVEEEPTTTEAPSTPEPESSEEWRTTTPWQVEDELKTAEELEVDAHENETESLECYVNGGSPFTTKCDKVPGSTCFSYIVLGGDGRLTDMVSGGCDAEGSFEPGTCSQFGRNHYVCSCDSDKCNSKLAMLEQLKLSMLEKLIGGETDKVEEEARQIDELKAGLAEDLTELVASGGLLDVLLGNHHNQPPQINFNVKIDINLPKSDDNEENEHIRKIPIHLLWDLTTPQPVEHPDVAPVDPDFSTTTAPESEQTEQTEEPVADKQKDTAEDELYRELFEMLGRHL